jgi:hypothetical protein
MPGSRTLIAAAIELQLSLFFAPSALKPSPPITVHVREGSDPSVSPSTHNPPFCEIELGWGTNGGGGDNSGDETLAHRGRLVAILLRLINAPATFTSNI